MRLMLWARAAGPHAAWPLRPAMLPCWRHCRRGRSWSLPSCLPQHRSRRQDRRFKRREASTCWRAKSCGLWRTTGPPATRHPPSSRLWRQRQRHIPRCTLQLRLAAKSPSGSSRRRPTTPPCWPACSGRCMCLRSQAQQAWQAMAAAADLAAPSTALGAQRCVIVLWCAVLYMLCTWA